MNYFINFSFRLFSDFYRLTTFLIDWRGHLRYIKCEPKYDVACITNFEERSQRRFRGFFSFRKSVIYGLRFSLQYTTGRYLLLNCTSDDLMHPDKRDACKSQAKKAIKLAVSDGASCILFAAGTKRLFSEAEVAELQKLYPQIIFTIGDNGTAMALLSDVFNTIKREEISLDSPIVVLGPNGFLGSVIVKALKNAGFCEIHEISMRDPSKLVDLRNIRLVIACTHFRALRLTERILDQIREVDGVNVIDVCKPANLSKKEFLKCKHFCKRQDSGMLRQKKLKYAFATAAYFILKRIHLKRNILYGCFSEALAIARNKNICVGVDFMSVNPEALNLVTDLLYKENFEVSEPMNFGKKCR